MELIYQDIPRSYTAIAEWSSCLIFILLLNRRYNLWKTGTIAICFLSFQWLFMTLTGQSSLYLWFPIMILAATNMFCLLRICCIANLTTLVYCTASAFLISEFTASLEWLLYYFIDYSMGG